MFGLNGLNGSNNHLGDDIFSDFNSNGNLHGTNTNGNRNNNNYNSNTNGYYQNGNTNQQQQNNISTNQNGGKLYKNPKYNFDSRGNVKK